MSICARMAAALVFAIAVAWNTGATAVTQTSAAALTVSIAHIKLLGNAVSVQFLVKNDSRFRQYIFYCALRTTGDASLDTGETLFLYTGNITGIPSRGWFDFKSCLNGIKLDDMSYIEPASSLIVSLRWGSKDNSSIPSSVTIFLTVARA